MFKKVFAVLLSLAVFASAFSLNVSAISGKGFILVNGEHFCGTLSQAITSAGENGLVEINGTVYTMPIGKKDNCLVTDVTIKGENNAKIILDNRFIMKNDDNLDVLTVKGQNVYISNINIDAKYRVDYAVCIYPGSNNVVIENVVAAKGIRGAVNVMGDGRIDFKNLQANYGMQTGFQFEACDGTNITFENCSTLGNWYKAGIIIKNGYNHCINIDASGITCYENCFSFHDRFSGTIGGDERQPMSLIAPPKDSNGNPISTDKAMYYPVEKSYLHIRYGISDKDISTACCYVNSSAYGFNSQIYFDDIKAAQDFLHEGESIEYLSRIDVLRVFFARLFNSVKIMFKICI